RTPATGSRLGVGAQSGAGRTHARGVGGTGSRANRDRHARGGGRRPRFVLSRDRTDISCTNSVKGKNSRRDPRVALSIVDVANPYRMTQLRGRVVERRRDPDFAAKDTLSRKYVGKPLRWRYPDGVILVIGIERARYQQIPLEHAPSS